MYYCKVNILFWVLVAFLAFLASCNTIETEKANIYFDSGVYIESELAVLKKAVTSTKTTVEINGEGEEISFEIDTNKSFKELESLFKEVNINNGIYFNEYQLDTFWMLDPITQQNIEVINYTTANPKLKVEWLQVYSNGSLKAKFSKSNFLFSYEKEIYYQKGSSFSVLSWQKTLGLDTLKIFNQVEYQ